MKWMMIGALTVFSVGVADAKPIEVSTMPPGAACVARQNARTVGYIEATPGVVSIDSTAAGLEILCEKTGHAPGIYALGDADTPHPDQKSFFDLLANKAVQSKLRQLKRVLLTLEPE